VSDKTDWRRRVAQFPVVFHRFQPSQDFPSVPAYNHKMLQNSDTVPPTEVPPLTRGGGEVMLADASAEEIAAELLSRRQVEMELAGAV
jgi:hypothetical protein